MMCPVDDEVKICEVPKGVTAPWYPLDFQQKVYVWSKNGKVKELSFSEGIRISCK